ncbi:MAG: hypothetical protein WC479_08050 [Candidatus Izemoplasmatales bacterium]
MQAYNFFDYKAFIDYHGEDFFGTWHKIYIIFAIVAIVLLCVFLRKASRHSVEIFLKIISIIVPILEACKIVWESSYDIALYGEFNWSGLLPLYTCSMFIYILPIAAWTKGKVRECALAFLTTIGVFAGLTNFFVPPILNTYPFFTYATFTSLYFHTLMVFTGVFLVTTKYYVPNTKSILKAFIPLVCFSAIVIPVNFYLNKIGYYPDYMLYMYGNGAPLLPTLAAFFGGMNLRLVYSLIVMLGYYFIIALFVGIYHVINLFSLMGRKPQSDDVLINS